MHTALKGSTPQLIEVSIAHLYSAHYTAIWIKNCTKSTSVTKVATMKHRNGVAPIDYCLKSEVSIMLCCHLCPTCYTAVHIKNYLKTTFVINVATIKNMDDSLSHKGSHHMVPTKLTLYIVIKDEWNTKKDTGKCMKMYCTYSGMPKTSLGLKQHWTVKKSSPLKNFVASFWKYFGSIWKLVWTLPNQYYPIVVWKNWGWFLGLLFCGPCLLFLTVVHDITCKY